MGTAAAWGLGGLTNWCVLHALGLHLGAVPAAFLLGVLYLGGAVNNDVPAGGVSSKARHRFEPGELAKVDKINLKRSQIDLFLSLQRGQFLGVPYLVVLAAIVAVVAWFGLNHTAFGRSVVAVGYNRVTAGLSGIRVPRIIVSCFVIGSGMAGRPTISAASSPACMSPARTSARQITM